MTDPVPPPAFPRKNVDSVSAERYSQVPRSRWLWLASGVVLAPVAGISATLSFQSLHEAALPIFGTLAVGFPLLADTLILGSTVAYLAGAVVGRPLSGWRWTAHAGVVATLVLNSLAASSAATIPWHITPGLVWSILVEMTARQVTGHWKNQHASSPAAIPTRLWVSNPAETTRTWVQMARTGERCHRQARADLAVQAAAVLALKTAMPRRNQRDARHLIRRQLRAGALSPGDLLGFLQTRDRENLTGDHVAIAVQASLVGALVSAEDDSIPADLGGHPHARGTTTTLPVGNEIPAQDCRSAPPTPEQDSGEQRFDGCDTGQRPRRASEERLRLTVDILRVKGSISAPHLMQELAARGWHVSPRTARRVLALATQELATTAQST